MMPNRDGIETIRDAKSRCPTTPILAMSGRRPTRGSIFYRLPASWGAAHIKKPLERAEFLNQVRTLLRR